METQKQKMGTQKDRKERKRGRGGEKERGKKGEGRKIGTILTSPPPRTDNAGYAPESKRGYRKKIFTMSAKHYALPMCLANEKTSPSEIHFHRFPTDPKCRKLHV